MWDDDDWVRGRNRSGSEVIKKRCRAKVERGKKEEREKDGVVRVAQDVAVRSMKKKREDIVERGPKSKKARDRTTQERREGELISFRVLIVKT